MIAVRPYGHGATLLTHPAETRTTRSVGARGKQRVGRRREAANATHGPRSTDPQRSKAERVLRALARRIERVREKERSELAREVHDVLGQDLTGLELDVAWMLRRVAQIETEQTAPLAERLQRMSKQLDEMVVTVRRIATKLRPGVLDDLGLCAALEWQAREFEERSGIRVDLAVPARDVTVDGERATAMFRIFQELLTNVARHAQARHVRAALTGDGDRLVLEFSDDGRGIDSRQVEHASSLGLIGIRERARAFGGDLSISGLPEQGTRASVHIRLAAAGAAN